MIRHLKKPRHNRHHEFLISFLVALFGFVNFYIPFVGASSLVNSKDLLGSSLPGIQTAHSIRFETKNTLNSGEKIKITFPVAFSNILVGNVACPTSSVASVSGQDVICTANAQIYAGPIVINVLSVVSPTTTAIYLVRIQTEDLSSNIIERSNVNVAITDGVAMTAYVDATLQFVVSGTSSNVDINGIVTTATSTATSTNFGTLVVDATSTIGQTLAVSTNASQGYYVTVEQNHELINATGDTINSFNNSPDGTASTSPIDWENPTGLLDAKDTYGHMGLSTSDADLGGGWSTNKYVGLSSTSPMVVMSHSGPADGLTQNKGFSAIAYTVKVSALQEAGDYSSVLTYICTPTY